MVSNASEWANLTSFQRDVIIATLRRDGTPKADKQDLPHGLGIKREVEVIRHEDVNHGRLYPNLDELVDAGYLTKGERDRRTNTYRVTTAGVVALSDYLTSVVGFQSADAAETIPLAKTIET